MGVESGLYLGRVTHTRLRPRRHRLGYRVFNLLLDLDAVGDLSLRLRLFSHDRFNLLSFHARDHGDGSGRPLRAQVEAMLAGAGIESGGRILLLCMPRLLGYVFNPLSVYFCHDADQRLVGIVYEVSNTFGERHSYVIPVSADFDGEVVRQRCAKCFYVSPFLDMDLTYAFEIRPPGGGVGVAVLASDRVGPVIATAFTGTRREITDAALARAVLAHPLITLKVVAGIHWEALLIWAKGIRIRPRPPPPAAPVSFIGARVD